MLRTATLYSQAIVECHGADGRLVAPETLNEFQRPDHFPDFTRVAIRPPPEPKSAVDGNTRLLHGGRAARLFANHAGFRPELLSRTQIDDLNHVLRSLWPQQSWARGELNVPSRGQEKAFSEGGK